VTCVLHLMSLLIGYRGIFLTLTHVYVSHTSKSQTHLCLTHIYDSLLISMFHILSVAFHESHLTYLSHISHLCPTVLISHVKHVNVFHFTRHTRLCPASHISHTSVSHISHVFTRLTSMSHISHVFTRLTCLLDLTCWSKDGRSVMCI